MALPIFGTQHDLTSSDESSADMTETIDGTATVLPLWYCDPSLSAPVCQGCPTSTTSGQEPCPTNFNFILLMPPLAIIGGLIPPPEGLPTLSIGPDGNPTPESTLLPTYTSVPPPTISDSDSSSTSSDNSISVSVPCTIAPITASSFAFSPVPSPVWTAPTGSAAPSLTEALPVLSLTNADPAHPSIWQACRPGNGDPYYNGGFIQFGESFSRNAGLDAVGKFCNDMVSSSIVVGPPGVTATTSGASKRTAVPEMVRSYNEPDGSGKIMLMVQSDVNNINGNGPTCPDNWIYDIASGGYAKCRQLFGQSIDYCVVNATRSSSDITWKNGGTVFTNYKSMDMRSALHSDTHHYSTLPNP
ncbi:uncharacterized protein LY89DRAFT_674072 [Mollisia scopiformis]|uniref:Uncharacterized protein n=1 Tax=Mollisia scopiformis TaxID=149040 RepID=A0A194WV74_MOLSC|nr:uncharacterized protein LY89DRAFT_674072 [Mollisia scopiformis]KUJ11487.1 hypothetical protein LY89DRAFT_674072 [Mollisia scopiformis]